MAHTGRTIRIVAAPEDHPPFITDAVTYEEDTYLVMSADPGVWENRDDPEQLMAQLRELRPKRPGMVVVEPGVPLRLLAVVHDLNLDPSWKEEWITGALDEIFRLAEQHRLRSLALPLLGTLYGSLDPLRFIALLRQSLERWSPSLLTHLWLVLPAGTSPETIERIDLALQK